MIYLYFILMYALLKGVVVNMRVFDLRVATVHKYVYAHMQMLQCIFFLFHSRLSYCYCQAVKRGK